MKKIISYFILVSMISCMTGCYSKESIRIASQINAETRNTVKQCIYDKYNFYPEILFLSEQPKTLSDYSFETFPSRDVFVAMRYKGKDFKTLVAGEYEYGKCYDNYQSKELQEQLEINILNSLPALKDFNPKITVLGGKNPKLANNLINTKYENNISEVIENEEPFYYIIEIASSSNILDKIKPDTFNAKTNIIILNYRDSKDIGFITQDTNLINENGMADIDKYSLYLNEFLSIQGKDVNYQKFDEITKFNNYFIIGQVSGISNNKEITSGMKIKKNFGGLSFKTDSEKDLLIYTKKDFIIKNNDMLSNFIVLQNFDSHVNIEKISEIGEYIYLKLKPDKNFISFNIVKKV